MEIIQVMTPVQSCLFLSALGLSCNISYPDLGRHNLVLNLVWLCLGNANDNNKGDRYIVATFIKLNFK